ncbi:hypothetical protein NDU88_008520 [Pleurodeles waltl]|uniref:Uncharacterized protein n=1 Tax=Pleurodeles waltl TaxID=8319 RepID=A0AAV7RX45_PLEWA|nr:hypothetical protein NDU88_008520 [Pleurodeles waltl]
MAGTGRLHSGTGTGRSQDAPAQDSQKLDAVLAAVERIGDSLERARTSLEAKIDKVASDLVLLHADHRKLVDKTGTTEALRRAEQAWKYSFEVWASAEGVALKRQDAMGIRKCPLSDSWEEMLSCLRSMCRVSDAEEPV